LTHHDSPADDAAAAEHPERGRQPSIGQAREGLELPEAINSLAVALSQAARSAQQGFDVYPVELTLLVTADRAESEPSRVEWRVLTADGAASGGPVAAHVLKLRFAPPTGQATRRKEQMANPSDAPRAPQLEVRGQPASTAPLAASRARTRAEMLRSTEVGNPTRGRPQPPPTSRSGRLLGQRDAAAVPRAENNAGGQAVERSTEAGPESDRPGLRDKFTDATAEYVAEKIILFAPQRLQWASTDLLNPADLSTALDRCQQALHNLAQHPVDELLTRAGAAPSVAAVASGIGANLVLAPMDQLIGSTSQLIDVAGILIGAVTGLHPLLIASANRLANVEVQNATAHVLAEALGGTELGGTQAPEPDAQNAAADLLAGALRGRPPGTKAGHAEAGQLMAGQLMAGQLRARQLSARLRAGPEDAKKPGDGKVGPGAGPRMGP